VRAVVAAHPAAGDPPDHLLLGDLQVEHAVQSQFPPGQVGVQRLGLAHVAREAVQQEALGGVVLGEPVLRHADGDLVRHQPARVHVRLRLLAEFGALADVGAEEVARGDVRDREVLGEERGLRPLARTGRPDQDDTHQRRNPS
jgi:hypothetical protein